MAGKSTAARQLSSALGAVVVSADQINEERGLPFGGEGLPESVWAETLRLQLERIQLLAAQGKSVISDDTLCYRWLRDRHREVAKAAGLKPVLLLFTATREALLQRHADLCNSAARPVIGLERLVSHLDAFEWPTPDEEAMDVSTPERLQALIRQLQERPTNAA